MKKIMLISLCMLLLCSCAKKEDIVISKVEPLTVPTKQTEKSDFYKTVVESDSRPMAVMIDNDDSNAWPQAGLNKAYKIYEIMVEGGATRFMALYKNTDCQKIGPVRSSRHYFLDYVLENDAIYTHFGWSPKAQSDIRTLGINNINGVTGSDGNTFWRERKYKGDWHSAYTSISAISETAQKKNYRNTTTNEITDINKQFEEIPGENATKIILPYSYMYKVTYNFDEKNNNYTRTMNTTPHQDSNGTKFTATNIIIQFAPNYSLGDGSARQQVDTTGSGTGFFITGGKYISIKWSKQSRSAKTEFSDANGNPIKLNPGTTWINLISKSVGCTIE